jgi:hypothetical protein
MTQSSTIPSRVRAQNRFMKYASQCVMCGMNPAAMLFAKIKIGRQGRSQSDLWVGQITSCLRHALAHDPTR